MNIKDLFLLSVSAFFIIVFFIYLKHIKSVNATVQYEAWYSKQIERLTVCVTRACADIGGIEVEGVSSNEEQITVNMSILVARTGLKQKFSIFIGFGVLIGLKDLELYREAEAAIRSESTAALNIAANRIITTYKSPTYKPLR